ncbi:major facilitator superfamily domain-containing protein [Chlamydoabsidia padenii]|nr:major facilitator superfamily domain-containing protein [Chlamydoabsidia padenii]
MQLYNLKAFYSEDPEKDGRGLNPTDYSENKSEEENLYGWIIVCIAFLIQTCTMGITASCPILTIGVFQNYYEQHVFGTSASAVFRLSLVGATANCFINLMSLLAQVLLSRLGSKSVLFVAAVLCAAGLELASLSTEIWHLILSIGVLYGSGCSLVFFICMSTLPQWFEKRQGMVLGIVSSGSCVGGLVFPLIITHLSHSVGIEWCCRALGLISFVMFLIACTFFKDKTALPLEKKKLVNIVDFSVLKNRYLLVWCLAENFIEAGYYVPFFFLPSYATSLGLSDSQGSLLVSMLSATNAIGRIVAGHLGDKIGYINTTIISCTICSISCLFIWTISFDFPMLMVFSCMCGLSFGVFVTMGPAITRIVEKQRFESAYSLFLIMTMLSMFGPNIAVGIDAVIHSGSFLTYKIFTGVAYFTGALILVGLKLRLTGGRLFACL